MAKRTGIEESAVERATLQMTEKQEMSPAFFLKFLAFLFLHAFVYPWRRSFIPLEISAVSLACIAWHGPRKLQVERGLQQEYF